MRHMCLPTCLPIVYRYTLHRYRQPTRRNTREVTIAITLKYTIVYYSTNSPEPLELC